MQTRRARAELLRPTIYEKPRPPLIDRFVHENRIEESSFRVFFKELLRKTRPEAKFNTAELKRILGVGLGDTNPSIILRPNGVAVSTNESLEYLTMGILLYNFHVARGLPSTKAAELTLDQLNKLTDRKAFPFVRPDFKSSTVLLIRMLARSISAEEVERTIDCLYNEPKLEARTEIDLKPEVVDAFKDRLKRLIESDPRLAIHFTSISRLIGILGDSVSESYFTSYLPEFDAAFHTSLKSFGSNHKAAILVYPWEADHLEKAREIERRGLSPAEPLGQLFIGDIEFALFRWVVGERLDHTGDSDMWGKFGKTVALAHERGIVLDDVAGRNAICDGTEIRLIDFEHTWFYEKPVPIKNKDRKTGLQRIRKELESEPKLFKAFSKGYCSIVQ